MTWTSPAIEVGLTENLEATASIKLTGAPVRSVMPHGFQVLAARGSDHLKVVHHA